MNENEKIKKILAKLMIKQVHIIEYIKYFEEEIYEWEKYWFEERSKYPVKIDVRTFEPLKLHNEFHVRVFPVSKWAKNTEPLDILKFRITTQNKKKLNEIINGIDGNFRESIAYFTHALIWYIDLVFANDKELYELRKNSPNLYKGCKMQFIGIDKLCSVLLYPPWLEDGYKTKHKLPYFWEYFDIKNKTDLKNIENIHSRTKDSKPSNMIYNHFFENIKIENLPEYKKEFEEHEKRLGLIKDKLDYRFIPPKEIEKKPSRLIKPSLSKRTSTRHKENIQELADKYWKFYSDNSVSEFYYYKQTQDLMNYTFKHVYTLKTIYKWVAGLHSPKPGKKSNKHKNK